MTEPTDQQPSEITLDEHTKWILGQSHLRCMAIARVLRERGHEIKERAEDEQAAVIHWMLNLYLKHGERWRDAARGILNS